MRKEEVNAGGPSATRPKRHRLIRGTRTELTVNPSRSNPHRAIRTRPEAGRLRTLPHEYNVVAEIRQAHREVHIVVAEPPAASYDEDGYESSSRWKEPT